MGRFFLASKVHFLLVDLTNSDIYFVTLWNSIRRRRFTKDMFVLFAPENREKNFKRERCNKINFIHSSICVWRCWRGLKRQTEKGEIERILFLKREEENRKKICVYVKRNELFSV